MEKERRELLIIFYRNPELGKVKTRLAASIGETKALWVYTKLSEHAREITKYLPLTKVVFYTAEVKSGDIWPDELYKKALQAGGDLGERMYNAFSWGFESGYDSICIIGTDCYELTTGIIEDAFSALHTADVVIGPAADGGYYLLGMRTLREDVFRHKQWSTETVFADTIKDLAMDTTSYLQLPMLRDVDTENDLPSALK